MDSFKDRERGFENKFVHDEDVRFKVVARRNRLIGLWAAEILGKKDEAATAYALEVVKADFEEAGHDDVVRKLVADLGSHSDEATVRAKMEEFLALAKEQVMIELPKDA